jgi:hypothetical protein
MDQMKTVYLAKMIAQEPMGQGFPEGQRCFGGVWPGVTHLSRQCRETRQSRHGEASDL